MDESPYQESNDEEEPRTDNRNASGYVERCVNVREQPRSYSEAKIATHHLVYHSEIADDHAFKIFFLQLEFDRSLKSSRREYATTQENNDAEYFPLIFYIAGGPLAYFINKDFKEEFTLPTPRETTNDATMPHLAEGEKRERFKISKKLYALGEKLSLNKGQFEELKKKLDSIETENREYAKCYTIKGNSPIHPDELRRRCRVDRAQRLYKEVRGKLALHIDLPDWCYSLMALWIMGTHVFELFKAYPYLYFQAELDSGKSRALDTTAFMSNNGKVWVDVNPAPLFRSIDAIAPTVLFDELENYDDDEQKILRAILNAGYKYGNTVPRCDTGLGRNFSNILDFKVFCPKAMASIRAPEPVLASRCINIPIARSLDPSFVDRDPNKDHYRYELEDIQKNLMLWSIEFGPHIAQVDMGGVFTKYREKFKSLQPRAFQIMLPLLAIFEAMELDQTDEVKNLEDMLEYQGEVQGTGGVSDAATRIIIALYKAIEFVKEGALTSECIRDMLNLSNEKEVEFFSAIKIGTVLTRYHIPKSKVHGVTQYLHGKTHDERRAIVQEIAKRYQIDLEIAEDSKSANAAAEMAEANLAGRGRSLPGDYYQ